MSAQQRAPCVSTVSSSLTHKLRFMAGPCLHFAKLMNFLCLGLKLGSQAVLFGFTLLQRLLQFMRLQSNQ